MKANLEFLFDRNVERAIKEIMDPAAKLKMEIFKAAMTDRKADRQVLVDYLVKANNFIRSWREYAEKLHDLMRDSKGNPSITVIKYEAAKEFLFGKYDYASVLPFVDGLFRGGKVGGKFIKADDVENFRQYTVSKAFRGRSDSIGGLVYDVTRLHEDLGSKGPSDSSEAALFNSVRNKDLFPRNDSISLYKAIEKSATTLFDNIGYELFEIKDSQLTDMNGAKMMTAVVNAAVDYMTYSMVAYATRIFAIAHYAYPHIRPSMYSEATEVQIPSASNYVVHVMMDADELISKDPTKVRDFMELLYQFQDAIGATNVIANARVQNEMVFDKYGIGERMGKNTYYQRLLGNELQVLLVTGINDTLSYGRFPNWIQEIRQNLHSAMYSEIPGIDDHGNAKQDVLHTIAGMDPTSETKESYDELIRNLIEYAYMILNLISSHYQQMGERRRWIDPSPNAVDKDGAPWERKGIDEILKLLRELYADVGGVIFSRVKDLEGKVNVIRNAEVQKAMQDVSIKIPGSDKSDHSSKHNLMSAIPDTMKQSPDLMDLYARPTYEAMQLYDEYVRSLPEMIGVAYYNEAVDISQLFNMLMSALQGVKKKWDDFFTDKYFQAAVKWTKAHQNDMAQMQFTPPMEVLPYKENTMIAHIDKMINAIQNDFNEDTVATEESLNAFIDSLYNGGDQKLISLFDTAKTDAKNATILYQNWVLFGLDPSVPGSINVQTKHLTTTEEIRTELAIWFGNVASADATYRSLQAKAREIDTAFNNLKSKVVGIKSKAANQQQSEEQAPPPPMTGQPNQPQQNQPQKPALDAKDLSDVAITKIKVVVDQLWVSLFNAITKSIKDQYKYIQEAYSRGRKPTT